MTHAAATVPTLLQALDPTRSVVVEACAGSGKTWLLVSRMLRLLLAGAEPGELLAITFTRKAAEEMRARLDDWLRELAMLADAEAIDFLVQRGLSADEAALLLPRARGLLERVLTARPGALITTFHGWFFHLLEHAPLSQRLGGDLIEHPALLREEAWFEFIQSLGRARGSPAETAFAALAAHLPLPTLRGLLTSLLARRAEWWAYQEGAEAGNNHAVQQACDALAHQLGVSEDEDVLAVFFSQPGLAANLETYAGLLAREADFLPSEAKRIRGMEAARAWRDHGQEIAFSALADCLLTGKGSPRALKLTQAMRDRQGDADAEHYVALHAQLSDDVQTTLSRRAEQRALWLHRHALVAGLSLIDTYQHLKAQQGGLDFTDAELETARLLADEVAAAAVFMKLDTRWKHLLLDEFQDTNPLQWRIVRAWLDAYGADDARPSVFMVGDPKQSIYRFRRAEPRLFTAAGAWLRQHYHALTLQQNETRRCAPGIVAWVNAVFSQRPDYPGFTPHRAHQQNLPAWCECFVAPPATLAAPPADGLRDPLSVAPPSSPPARQLEAAWVASRIRAMVGTLQLATPLTTPQAALPARTVRYRDITLLYAKRAEIEVFEQAFVAAGIPFITDRRGELLGALEVQDLTALLTCLLDPHDNLALAHALKSPVFGLDETMLLQLSMREADGTAWRARLGTWASEAEAPAEVQRAAHLLSHWQASAGTLPTHDLLDHIYHQGEVSTRYHHSTLPRQRASVQANLDAFLNLALTLSGGRYPSLPRFLDELKRLRDKAGQDGPDEPPHSDGDAVRMLTIHSAKGLEAPVVFLIKADASMGRDDTSGILMDWPPEAERPLHFSLFGASEWRGPGRKALFDHEKAQAATERSNLLYVAMTRARQALLVSGVRAQDGPAAGADWLIQLETALARVDLTSLPGMHWSPDESASVPGSASPPTLAQEAGLLPGAGIGKRRSPQTAATASGVRLHAWLELCTGGLDTATIRQRLGLTQEQADACDAAARRILALPQLAPAFDATRYLRAHNELTFVDANGRLARMDRLIEFADEVWILDYKSGGLDEPDAARRATPHLAQIVAYRDAAARLFPGKPVRAALVFSDGLVHWHTHGTVTQ